jgi:hypothetical protein
LERDNITLAKWYTAEQAAQVLRALLEKQVTLADWYTASEAAQLLNTTTKYVRQVGVKYGKFTTYKLNMHTLLYLKQDVNLYQVNKGQPGRPTKEQAA